MIPLFDLHCDTVEMSYDKNVPLSSKELQNPLHKNNIFSPFAQVCAIWSDYKYSDKECYIRYRKILDYIRSQDIKRIKKAKDFKKGGIILSIEDARLTENNLKMLDEFNQDGIKTITLTWRGKNNIGGGWDTDIGLTDYGRLFVEKCFDLSIIPDVSHSSHSLFRDLTHLSVIHNMPFIASHSNSYTICPHKRNITDNQFNKICELGGIVGISLVPEHLNIGGNACVNHIINHIAHFLRLGGENVICLGTDFDGTDHLPSGIRSSNDLLKLYFTLTQEFGEAITSKIYFKNAYNFFIKQYN